MRQIALDYLYQELDNKKPVPIDLNQWYEDYSKNNPGEIISYLIEAVEEGKQVILFVPDPQNNELINVSLSEVKNDSYKYPFVKPSSGNSPQIGPVLKLGYRKGQGLSPKPKIMKQTIEKWEKISKLEKSYSSYFGEILKVLKRPCINVLDKYTIEWKAENFQNPIDCFIQKEGDNYKDSLIIINTNGRTPGESKQYHLFLQENLVEEKYVVKKIDRIRKGKCSLCFSKNLEVFPNGVKGAGINLGTAGNGQMASFFVHNLSCHRDPVSHLLAM